MYHFLRFIWMVEWRNSSTICIVNPVRRSSPGASLATIAIERAADISGNGTLVTQQLFCWLALRHRTIKPPMGLQDCQPMLPIFIGNLGRSAVVRAAAGAAREAS